ncbi:hypothetical protein TBLA_0D03950 [Henningerozyma blattae CBS 6284]|uniref:F-box domain-containing protein n=1 Tax=Henningerozyma blattae (strain ATCC 34711 / CBS 6284 / DSM 70876 / NBRC 10599 / NRRL Y-10934 / UCD 77-7) TaxID=1071380 RepID=I2H3E0_HENB6|nr:hypothetical protein TBLA_0D03950 [Tetrapisispora blattae CBS 6284]CCH60892.1 hypothetical protein TBLA_0D03950 [Tetrapisispora blattae CBS 6284]
MLDILPNEVFEYIVSMLAQEDKTSLMYLNKKMYLQICPLLYRNIYLNERFYVPVDLDSTFGTHYWSVLYFRFDSNSNDPILAKEKASYKFSCLVRSLFSNTELFKLIRRVHCNWNLDQDIFRHFIHLLIQFADNLQEVDNFLKVDISNLLIQKSSQLISLTIPPPSVLPNKILANEQYFSTIRSICNHYNFDNLQSLTIHPNSLTFFPKLSHPLKIKSLSLNLRPDTHIAEGNPNTLPIQLHYYDIFDVNSIKELEILSWYDDSITSLDLYEMWNLNDFWEFHNIENLVLLSLFSNTVFLENCITNFYYLKKLKVDYMFDSTVSLATINSMANNRCSKTIEYIDIKFVDVDPPLLSIDQDEISMFRLHLNCKCDDCQFTFKNIILKKYFPTQDTFIIKDYEDVKQRNFIQQMFRLYPIIPYSQGYNEYPAIGFNMKPLSDFVEKINELLKLSINDTRALTVEDIRKIYFVIIHSYKRSYDIFLRNFPNLKFLILNDLPTKITSLNDQKCNIPLFHCEDYKSNQVYEIVDANSLFS